MKSYLTADPVAVLQPDLPQVGAPMAVWWWRPTSLWPPPWQAKTKERFLWLVEATMQWYIRALTTTRTRKNRMQTWRQTLRHADRQTDRQAQSKECLYLYWIIYRNIECHCIILLLFKWHKLMMMKKKKMMMTTTMMMMMTTMTTVVVVDGGRSLNAHSVALKMLSWLPLKYSLHSELRKLTDFRRSCSSCSRCGRCRGYCGCWSS